MRVNDASIHILVRVHLFVGDEYSWCILNGAFYVDFVHGLKHIFVVLLLALNLEGSRAALLVQILIVDRWAGHVHSDVDFFSCDLVDHLCHLFSETAFVAVFWVNAHHPSGA